MRKIFSMFLAACLFVACGGGDDSGSNPGGGGTTPTPQPQSQINFSGSTTPAPTFSVEGGETAVTFTASDSWTASVANTRSGNWCSVNPTSGAAGSATITVKTTANDTPDDRSAVITLECGNASKTFTVSQKQKDALTVTQSRFEVSADGEVIKVEVKANINFEWSISQDAASWIENVETRALTTTVLSFNIKENTNSDSREGTITITSGEFSETITVCQAGFVPSMVISQKSYNVEAGASAIKVEVASNVNVEVYIPDSPWITENATRATSTHTYHFNIAENTTTSERTGKIVFLNTENALEETVTVTQAAGSDITFNGSVPEIAFEQKGGDAPVEFTASDPWTASVDKDWCSVSPASGEAGSATITVTAAANETSDERSAVVTLKCGNVTKTFTVSQKQKNMIEVPQSSFSVNSNGGVINIEVKSNIDYTYSVDKDAASWIKEVKTRALNSKVLSFEIDKNTATTERIGKITISNQENAIEKVITITQKGVEPVNPGGNIDDMPDNEL